MTVLYYFWRACEREGLTPWEPGLKARAQRLAYFQLREKQ